MALFSRSKKDEAGAVSEAQSTKPKKQVETEQGAKVTDRNLSAVIIKPRITEKAVGKSEQNVYTFVVQQDATKYDVRDAVKQQWGVTPVKVNIVNKTARQYRSRSKGRTITEKGMKKAYVYLQAGDSIELA